MFNIKRYRDSVAQTWHHELFYEPDVTSAQTYQQPKAGRSELSLPPQIGWMHRCLKYSTLVKSKC